jgi:transcription elongation GreA/GreB family factor
LRENHEHKAAKEMQKLLMRRKGELETQLVHARGTDFANVRTEVVSIGTKVQATELNSNHVEIYTILGAWDSDPDKNIISYLTPVAQTLLNRKVGEEVAFETHGVQKRFRIDTIGPAKPEAEPAATAASAAAN